jgi:hypothetical protein
LVSTRFRYVAAATLRSTSQRWTTYRNDEITLLQGNGDPGALNFTFYRSSADTYPAANVAYTNKWPEFSMYLYGSTTREGRVYSRLQVRDGGVPYNYYVEVKFANPVPLPAEWPKSANWPNTVIVNGVIVKQ